MNRIAYLTSLILLLSWQSVDAQSTQKVLHYLALGDSYTIGEAVPEAEQWPRQLMERISTEYSASIELDMVAKTGWTTDELAQGIKAASLRASYDVVSLLIGVNNQYRGRPVATFIPEFESLLQQAIAFAGNNPQQVFVVSIPNYGYTPFGLDKQAEITQGLAAYNQATDSICTAYGVQWINITPTSEVYPKFPPGWIAKDKLHPGAGQYTAWVEAIYPRVKSLFE